MKYAGDDVLATQATSNFEDDNTISDWAKNDVYMMQEKDLINGKDGNEFNPSGKLKRSEFASILQKYVTQSLMSK